MILSVSLRQKPHKCRSVAKLKNNQGYLAVEERKMGLTKKKRFTGEDTRGMQTRVNLKFPEMKHTYSNDNLNRKHIPSEDVVNEFNRQFDSKFSNHTQKLRDRNVSNQSPFSKLNKPLREYVESDTKLPPNPTKSNPVEFDVKKIPVAGHISDIGQRILEIGSRKAVHMTTLNWGIGESLNNSPPPPRRESPSPRPFTTMA